MSTQKHTPGPWHVGFKPGPIVYGLQGEQVANLFEPLIDAEENKANARLIACAPELLEALKEMAEQFSHYCEHTEDAKEIETLIKARAAISKAEGVK
jgi:hypothetical protein